MGTLMKCTGDFLKGSYEGRNMRFGIREFGMGAVCNAISLDKTGLVPYCATFTIFSDYMRNAIRLSALAQCGTIFVTTHDSIAVGEDGPTHQPIETIPSLRMIPDITVIRPADCNETSGAYKVAMEKSKLESMGALPRTARQLQGRALAEGRPEDERGGGGHHGLAGMGRCLRWHQRLRCVCAWRHLHGQVRL